MRTTAPRAGSVPTRVQRVPVLHRLAGEQRLRVDPLALVVALGAVLAAVTAAVLLTVRDGWGLPGAHEVPVDLAVAVAYPLTGLLVLTGARSARHLGRLLVAVGVAAAAATVATSLAVTATRPTDLAVAAAWVHSWAWVPGFFPLLTLLPLVYPDGRLVSDRWRPAAGAALLGTALLTVGMALRTDPLVGRVRLPDPVTADGPAVVLCLSGAALLAGSAVAGLASLVLRVRRSTGLARRQVVVLGVAAAVLLVEALVHPALPDAVGTLTQVTAVVLLPVAVAVAATRHRLYDLDAAVLRALVGVSLAASLAGAYVTAVSLLTAVLPDGSAAVPATAAAATGLLVQPLGARLSRAADRLWYGDRADPYAVLAGASARLREGVAPDEVPAAVCTAVVGALRLGGARLVLGADPAASPAAAVGRDAGPSAPLVLRHRGAVVGHLHVTLRAGEARLDERDAELLASLCDQAAPALAALALTEQLQRSREALVAGREEERRRLRRDLHDGIGAALSGARLQLESARELVDDPRVGRMLDAAGRAVAEAVGDVHRLTEDLRPPALDELGLAGSLQGLAERIATPSLQVTTDLAEPTALPAAVEVACFRIAAEALNNAARHAGAGQVRLRLAVEAGGLVVEVADDGRGIPAQRGAPRGGLGLGSMRQRAEEVGGALEVLSTGGGTTVRARLPLEAGARSGT